jgi:hypothetical protein
MRREITDEEFWQQLSSFERSAWRFEQQPTYDISYEEQQLADFVAGKPLPPAENPELRAWLIQVERQRSEGKSIGRVRIVDEPLTDYQRWLRWLDGWWREAGEEIRYLSRRYAVDTGLLPASSTADWWLFDDDRLMLMHFDEHGVRTGVELLESEPEVVAARRFREAAVRTADDEASAPRRKPPA